MPSDPKASSAEKIISAIQRLSERSAELKESAKRNGVEAARLAELIAILRREFEQLAKR